MGAQVDARLASAARVLHLVRTASGTHLDVHMAAAQAHTLLNGVRFLF